MECRLPIPENERVSLKEQNDQAQLRAAQSENNMKDESGALAAAPCSAPRMVLVRNKLVPDLSEEEHALADEMDKDPDFICCGNRIISCLEDFRALESVMWRSLAKNGGRPIAFYYSISRDKTN